MPDNKLYVTANVHTAKMLKRLFNTVSMLFIVVGIIGVLFLLLGIGNIFYFTLGILLIILSAINTPLPITLSYRIVGGCELPFRIMMLLTSRNQNLFSRVYYYHRSYQIEKLSGGVMQ